MAGAGRRSTLDASAIAQSVSAALGIDGSNQTGGRRRSSLTGRSSFSDLGGGLTRNRSSLADLGATFDTLTSQIGGGTEAQENNLRATRRSTITAPAAQRGSILDVVAEEAFNKENLENTPCYTQCVQTDLGQFYCTPADYATRHKNKENNDEDAVQAKGGARSFGLAEWESSGYRICELNEVELSDPALYTVHGLRIAIHGHTSIRRYALVIKKSTLPPGISGGAMSALIKGLMKLNHIYALRCHDVYEDASSLYFMYEFWPCTCVQTVFEESCWSQEEIVSIVSNCVAATAFANSLGLYHLGFSLNHILLPQNGSKIFPVKVFGFGLAGVVLQDMGDRYFWAPEAAERYMSNPENHAGAIDKATVKVCDSWSLGVIAYTLIADKAPFTGAPDKVLQKISIGKWAFSPGFDDMDPVAKTMMEQLLERNKAKRMKPDQAIASAWLRNWRRPPGDIHGISPDSMGQAFDDLDKFCEHSKAKRLFGRFLLKFLGPEQRLLISRRFNIMDTDGDGLLSYSDLDLCAQNSFQSECHLPARRHKQVNSILSTFSVNLAPLSIVQYGESWAELLIDGAAMRNAFESLDDDGSEEITAKELFDNLCVLDDSLTLEEIAQHIAEAEGGLEDHGDADHCIDFEEFVNLFPERIRRLKEQSERVEGTKLHAAELLESFGKVDDKIDSWGSKLEQFTLELEPLSGRITDLKENSMELAQAMQKICRKMKSVLVDIPGNEDFNLMSVSQDYQDLQKKKDKAAQGKLRIRKEDFAVEQLVSMYDVEKFMQVEAVRGGWVSLLNPDITSLKEVIRTGAHSEKKDCDRYRAHDVAECVVMKTKEISEWVKAQHEEYKSITDAMMSVEPEMPKLPFSGRGLRRTAEDDKAAAEARAAAAAGLEEEGGGKKTTSLLCGPLWGG